MTRKERRMYLERCKAMAATRPDRLLFCYKVKNGMETRWTERAMRAVLKRHGLI